MIIFRTLICCKHHWTSNCTFNLPANHLVITFLKELRWERHHPIVLDNRRTEWWLFFFLNYLLLFYNFNEVFLDGLIFRSSWDRFLGLLLLNPDLIVITSLKFPEILYHTFQTGIRFLISANCITLRNINEVSRETVSGRTLLDRRNPDSLWSRLWCRSAKRFLPCASYFIWCLASHDRCCSISH